MKLTYQLVLIFLTLSLSLTSFAKKNCVRDQLQALRESHHIGSSGKLPQTEDEYRAVFDFSQKKYLRKVDFKKMEETLEEIMKNGPKKVGESSLERLKSDRILAQRVRGNYILFSAENASPRGFHKFVRDLGYLNDAIIEGKSKVAREMAEKVLKHMREGKHLPENSPFIPAKAGSIHQFAEKKFAEIEGLLVKPIDIHAYHDIKKDIRNFKFLFAVLNKHSPHPTYEDLGRQAAHITDVLGDRKDFLFRDASVDKDALVTIEPNMQAAIRKFFSDFRKANK